MSYQHLLVAVDLTDDCHRVIERAVDLVAGGTARMTLVHVLEPIAKTLSGEVSVDVRALHQQRLEQAGQRITELRARHPQLREEDCQLPFGQPAEETHRLAKELGCDLIVTGSHGRHGLALLFGSTSNALLHGASCDVLAVHLPKA
jgi:universal stress protein A